FGGGFGRCGGTEVGREILGRGGRHETSAHQPAPPGVRDRNPTMNPGCCRGDRRSSGNDPSNMWVTLAPTAGTLRSNPAAIDSSDATFPSAIDAWAGDERLPSAPPARLGADQI